MRAIGTQVLRITLVVITAWQGLALTAQCPVSILSITESCDEQEAGVYNTAVDISASFDAGCSLQEVCFSRLGDGEQLCTDVSGLGLSSGDLFHLALPGPGVYLFWVSTASGSSELTEMIVNCYDDDFSCQNPYAVNYNLSLLTPSELACVYDTYICDCSGNHHAEGVLIHLGDGVYNTTAAGVLWNGIPVDFSCNVWGFDCGDGNINFDPYGVCDGDLPPNNGCSSPGCNPLTLSISQNPCQVSANGMISSLLLQFGIGSACEASLLCYSVNGGAEECISLPAIADQENFLFPLNGTFGSYKFHFETSSGAVSPFFYFTAQDLCGEEEQICDCAGNTWPLEFTNRLGDGFLNDGSASNEGYHIDFNCLQWAYDCSDGDLIGDPYNVCEGGLPPQNGCGNEPLVPGCTDLNSCNFDPQAAFDDGSCDYSCIGCMDENACDYDPAATIDSGECFFPDPGYSCLGTCLNDANQNGICDEFEVYGCTYDFACNYNPDATIDDGSCERLSCTGCTNMAAVNFDASASLDDGSCEFNFSSLCPADLDSNSQVAIADLLILISMMGLECSE